MLNQLIFNSKSERLKQTLESRLVFTVLAKTSPSNYATFIQAFQNFKIKDTFQFQDLLSVGVEQETYFWHQASISQNTENLLKDELS